MKYRKKPVVIEARQLDDESESRCADIASWCGGELVTTHYVGGWPRYGVVIDTLEGDMRGTGRDFIIRGVQGEFYPCKPDIFHETYEEV